MRPIALPSLEAVGIHENVVIEKAFLETTEKGKLFSFLFQQLKDGKAVKETTVSVYPFKNEIQGKDLSAVECEAIVNNFYYIIKDLSEALSFKTAIPDFEAEVGITPESRDKMYNQQPILDKLFEVMTKYVEAEIAKAPKGLLTIKLVRSSSKAKNYPSFPRFVGASKKGTLYPLNNSGEKFAAKQGSEEAKFVVFTTKEIMDGVNKLQDRQPDALPSALQQSTTEKKDDNLPF